MGYIIVVRNPRNNKLIAVSEDADSTAIAEFDTAEDAEVAAQNTTICRAWPYEVIEVDP